MTDATDIARLRRLTAEPSNATYEDATMLEYLHRYPLRDSDLNEPDESDWTPTYDFNAAAADIWDEKAAGVAANFTFQADGGTYHEDEKYKHALGQARYHSARRRAQNRAVAQDISSV